MEIQIKTSIIDYVSELEGGVNILISLTLDNNYSFEAMYWIHPTMDSIIEIEENFLKLFGATKPEDLLFLKDLIEDIESILPPKEDIFKEFNI